MNRSDHVTSHKQAGAGKTVLASAVIEFLQDKANASPCGDMHSRYPGGLVRQALERHPHLQPLIALSTTDTPEKTQPTQDELVFVLVSISKQFRTIFFAIDGLDEAHRSVRLGILKALPSCNVKYSDFETFGADRVAVSPWNKRLIDEKLDGTLP
ncbi:hypothetical protein BKA70DRAFT_1443887 [Coprinopsis sp. MPI-PUGE-AT-0042]|nr:hypothetical protein BKA70DRAFT_1443887 [Coprinopsis sp. MPI-PUGE-AT-0042]